MGQAHQHPGGDEPFEQGQVSTRGLAWNDEDDLFGGPDDGPLCWLAEARVLLTEALEKTPSRERGAAHRRAHQQVEAVARRLGATEITAELVGLALGGMSVTTLDDG